MYVAFEYGRSTIQLGEILFIDIVNGISSCGQCHLEGVSIGRHLHISTHTTVDSLDVGGGGSILTYTVKDADECSVALAVHLAQFDADQLHLLPNLSSEEIG